MCPRRRWGALACACLALRTSGGRAAGMDLGPVQEDPRREWTIVAYFDADNNLEAPILATVNEIEANIPDQGIDVILLLDRAKGFLDADGDWTDARVLRIRRDADPARILSPILSQPGELNLGDPAVLSAFLGAALRTFPARRRLLLFQDHGGGWATHCLDDDAPGAPGGKDSLTLPETREAIEKALADAGIQRLDIIGLHECLMAQLETGVEFAGVASFLIASEAVAMMQTWSYKEMLAALAAGERETREIATRMVEAFHKGFDDGGGTRPFTMSAVDLGAAEEVVRALDALMEKCGASLAGGWPAFARALFYAKSYAARTEFLKGPEALSSIDLVDGLKRIRYGLRPFPAEAEYQALLRALSRYIVTSKANEAQRLSNGVAIYAPVSAAQVRADYGATRLARMSRWPSALAEVHRLEREALTPARFADPRLVAGDGTAVQAARPIAGIQLAFALEGNNIVWIQRWDGVQDAGLGGLRLLRKGYVIDPNWPFRLEEALKAGEEGMDLLMPQYVDGRNDLKTDIDGLDVRITNGEGIAAATILDSSPELGEPFRAMAFYGHPSVGGEIPVTIHFHTFRWSVLDMIAVLRGPDGSIIFHSVAPEADARLTFLSEVLKPDGTIELAKGAALEWRNGLELILASDPPGDYATTLVAETMAGVRSAERVAYRMGADPELGRTLQGWKAFRPEMLIGTWDQFILDKDGTRIPTGAVYEIAKRSPSDGRIFAGRATVGAKRAEVTWMLDLRGLPGLRIFEWKDTPDPTPAGFYVGPASFSLGANGRTTLSARMVNFGGLVWVFERRGRLIDAERYKPVPVPEPEPLK